MKLSKTIKRIAAVGAGATMLGATVLGAMAADLSEYPKPMFIKDGKFDGLIVIGADADTQDMLGAMDIISSLQAVAVGASGTTSATVETVGDVYQFAKSSDKLNMGETINQIRPKLYDTQLPIVLADGSLTTATGNKYDYEQVITIPSAIPALQFFADKDYENEKPVLGMKIARNSVVLNYTLEFTKAAKSAVNSDGDFTDFEDRQIEMLGEVYDIIGSDNSTNVELDLMRGALKPTLEEGETATYKINGKDYEVTALIIEDNSPMRVKFKINGEVTDSMGEGDVYKTTDGTLIGVREVMPNEAGDVTQDMVEFYIGAKKIILLNGNEVEIDNEDISNLKVYFTTSGSGSKEQIEKIRMDWVADDDLFVTEDKNEVMMPGLESIKIWMDGFYNGKEEKVTFGPSSDDTFTIEAPLANYDVKLDVLYAATANNWSTVGASTSKKLITNTCNATNGFSMDMDDTEYAVITKKSGKEGESAIIQLTKAHNIDGVTIKDYAGDVIAENKKVGKTFDVADLTVTVQNYSQADSTANFTVAGNCANYMLITKEGLQISLPQNGGFLNVQGANSSFQFVVSEEDKDENIGAGQVYWVNATFNSGNEAHALFPATSEDRLSNGKLYSVDDSKVYVGYTLSNVSTKVTYDKTADQYDVELSYPGEETYGDLFIGSKASKVTTSAAGESVAVSKIEVGAAVLDGSLASYTNQNLIVVGGPAINKAAAALLGKTYPAYGAESGIPENAGLIKLVEQTDGTVAMIVAGWEADDTQRACRVVAESGDYALSGKEVQITGTSMTDIQVGVPATA